MSCDGSWKPRLMVRCAALAVSCHNYQQVIPWYRLSQSQHNMKQTDLQVFVLRIDGNACLCIYYTSCGLLQQCFVWVAQIRPCSQYMGQLLGQCENYTGQGFCLLIRMVISARFLLKERCCAAPRRSLKSNNGQMFTLRSIALSVGTKS